jgi:hypothetical protein
MTTDEVVRLANYVRCNSFPEERRKDSVACTL